MVGPEAFTEVRYLAHLRQLDALTEIPRVAAHFADAFDRSSGGLVRPYRLDDAETVVVALGSVLGTIKDTVDAMRECGERIGVLGITTFRPFPGEAVRKALRQARRVVVVDRAVAAGAGGIVAGDVRVAMGGEPATVFEVIAGLGGRAVTTASLTDVFSRASTDALPRLTFLDLDVDAVAAALTADDRSAGRI
jgi:pyruvate ferredoxin oxidoreductase alpha subunit